MGMRPIPDPGAAAPEQEEEEPQKQHQSIEDREREWLEPRPHSEAWRVREILQAIPRADGARKECEVRTSPKPRAHPVGLGRSNYVFGDVVGVDVLEVMDSQRDRFSYFNIADFATGDS